MRNLALVWVLAGVAVALLAAGDGKPSVSTYTDKRDGKVYKIVKIGSQVWFAENLNYAAKGSKCYGEGGTVTSDEFDEDGILIQTTLSNAEVQANCKKYGRLYNWKTALAACPAGTHLPTDKELTTLVKYVGDSTAGTKLMSSTGWNSLNGVPTGTNEYGFSALPGGYGYSDGDFDGVGDGGLWWSATKDDDVYAIYWYMYYGHGYVDLVSLDKTYFYSVRCVLDNEKERRK